MTELNPNKWSHLGKARLWFVLAHLTSNKSRRNTSFFNMWCELFDAAFHGEI